MTLPAGRAPVHLPPRPVTDSGEDTGPGWNRLEGWPKWLICVPLALQWLWLGARHGSLTLPSAANPGITAGGLVGEGKLEYFGTMGPLARVATATHIGIVVDATTAGSDLRALLRTAGLAFPLVAKPDKGLCGHGVRRVDSLADLREYLALFPRGETVVLQAYLAQEGEAGIFYVRDPRSGRGRVIGLALRDYPRVTGDGSRTIGELIAADRRLRRLTASPLHRCTSDLTRVPLRGEVVRLSTVGSTRVGGLYRDGADLITPELTAAIARIADDMRDFDFGRFDVRFASTAQLARGEDFAIMEVNGAGSEAIEAWDPRTGALAGLRKIFAKQRLLFEVADARRRAGARPIGLLALARLNRAQLRLNAAYPASN